MPSEVMEQDSSHLFEEIRFPSEKQVRKLKALPDHLVGMDSIGAIPGAGGKLDSSSPMHNFLPNMGQPMPQSDKAVRQSTGVVQGTDNISRATWKPMDNDIKLWSDLCVKPASYSFDGKNNLTNGIHHESSLFSSSLSEVFCRKSQLPGNDAIRHQPVNPVLPSSEDPFNCLEDIEGKTIGNLLPDDDDLFSGMTDVLGLGGHGNTGDEFEDFDLFSNGGGLELGDDRSSTIHRKYDLVGGMLNCQVGSNGSVTGGQPSRTLFVRNINSNVEDSELKALFERYGDIRTLYTASKHRGFVMISYYDIRAAHNAMRVLQNQPMKHRNLDIHYSLPKDNPSDKDVNQGILMISNLDSSVSNNELHQLFGIYGEIKQVHETPDKHRLIEFYDVRAAEMASRALNKTNISGKQIKLESAFNGGAGPSVVQLSNLEQDVQEAKIFRSICDNLAAGQKAKVGPDGIPSSCMAIGSNQSFHAAMRSPMMQSVDDGFSHQSSSLPNTLPSPMRMMSSTGKHFGFCESSNSLDEMKFANQGIQGFHPHSLPEHHDTHGIPSNPTASIAQMTNLGGLGVTEGYASHIHGVNINRHPRDLKGVFGSFGSGSSNSVREQHCGWNNSSSYQQLSSSSMGLRNSPSFVNGLHEHRFPQTPGLPRPHILSSSSLPHHIGSAPAVNPSLWERHAYSPGNAGLHHLGSLGSAGGFPGSPQLHLMDIAASQKMFSQVGGSCMDMSTAQHSPHHMFPGRNQVSMPTSFDSLRENGRNFSQRRNEANSNNLDKRQYDLDVDRILHGDDSRTTLMIKNIPNKYTSKMLLAAIDEHCRGTYDFLYLPIDFKNKCNVGYAFINMVDPRQIIPFHQAFNGKKWEKFNSEKVATLAYARIQGKTALIAHFQNSSLMNEDKRCRPILFHTDGPNAGDPEPFPMGTNIRSRSGRSRTNGNDENHQGSPSVAAIRDEAYDSASGSSKDSD